MIILTQEQKVILWGILGKYKDERLKLNWGPFRPSVKVGAILVALLGPEPT